MGELCQIETPGGNVIPAEVIGFREGIAHMMPFSTTGGLRESSTVTALGRSLRVPVGRGLLGRVLNGLGVPQDHCGPLIGVRRKPIVTEAPAAIERPPIDQPFLTGTRVIDGLLTCGRGQRVGLFAGSGVGKSTLLGDIARGADSDVNVVAMIGERGREVRPFLERCLGAEGLARSVVVVSTSSDPPLMRLRAAETAITIADAFRKDGADVLLMLDSLTRLAHAGREIGLQLGEPPSSRGYPPSVFQSMSQLLELMGRTEDGSITAILTVLVDGDDTEEPVADAARAILDGHIVLDRDLAQKGHFPAVNLLASISRVFDDVVAPEHHDAAVKLRNAFATYMEVADLIRIGGYARGTSPQIDAAIDLMPHWETFARQTTGTVSDFNETRERLIQLSNGWK